MASNPTTYYYLILLILFTGLITTHHLTNTPTLPAGTLRSDKAAISSVGHDYGNIVHHYPAAVLHPSSVHDIVNLIKLSYNNWPTSFPVAARGRGHSVNGQAMVAADGNGVVVDMMRMSSKINVSISVSTAYADVGGEVLWRDVLDATLAHGVAPRSWTDYLYLSVGGTLSNGGISGQSFCYGPQISNVLEMDVVTGTGNLVTCSPSNNTELFYAVLGGLGQFGIITRARIPLHPAPKRVHWVRLLYNDFNAFTTDQESLISIHGRKQQEEDYQKTSYGIDYLEGSLMLQQGDPNNWRSSFFSRYDVPRVVSLLSQHPIIYCLEFAISYSDHDKKMEEEIVLTLEGLSFIPGFVFTKDVTYVDFLDRVRAGELQLQSQGLWEVPHPWLNLFVPRSRIHDFHSGVLVDIVLRRNITAGPVLIYPMHANKWEERSSAVIAGGEEGVFYAVGFLHSSGYEDWERFQEQNEEIMEFCDEAGMGVKQYLARYGRRQDWIKHFGSKWTTFRQRKSMFDPRMMLSPGQRIFN
ncbi:Cytokinin dehydrogenase 3 [Linum grandiflorum]